MNTQNRRKDVLQTYKIDSYLLNLFEEYVKKYELKKSEFIRQAVYEKMRRDKSTLERIRLNKLAIAKDYASVNSDTKKNIDENNELTPMEEADNNIQNFEDEEIRIAEAEVYEEVKQEREELPVYDSNGNRV